MKERKTWLDGLRALAMLFVMYGHLCAVVRPFNLFSSPIKLPLFFAVTGYVFSFRGGDMRAFLKGIWRHLAAPWLVFGSVYTIVKIISGTPAGEALYEFASGNVAWYIPCLIAAEIVFFFVCKAAKKPALQYIALFAVAAAGYCISKAQTPLWTFVGRMMIVQFYMLIGYVFRNLDAKITKAKLWPAVFGLIYVLVGACVLVGRESSIVDVQSNSYYDIRLYALMAVCGCSFLFYYARFVRMPGWLIFIGQNTLIFYLFHARILDMLMPLINAIPYELRSNVLIGLPISLGILAVLCGVCAVCSRLINRYLPFLAGKSRRS